MRRILADILRALADRLDPPAAVVPDPGIARNEEAEHAVQRVEARPPLSATDVASRMRDGTF